MYRMHVVDLTALWAMLRFVWMAQREAIHMLPKLPLRINRCCIWLSTEDEHHLSYRGISPHYRQSTMMSTLSVSLFLVVCAFGASLALNLRRRDVRDFDGNARSAAAAAAALASADQDYELGLPVQVRGKVYACVCTEEVFTCMYMCMHSVL